MYENEQYAHDLASAVEQRLGVRPAVEGAGVRWHVDVGEGCRISRVHCIHYEDRNPFESRTEGTLTLGMGGNAHQSKVQVGQRSKWKPGAEYQVDFHEGEKRVATCRVRSVADVLDASERWLAGATLPDMHEAFDFVDQRTRQRRQISEELTAELSRFGSTIALSDDTSGFGGAEYGELWAYGGERSCRIATGADGLEAALLLHRTQLARVGGLATDELAHVLARWIEERWSTTAMSEGPGRWEIIEQAELFEQGRHADWHWVQVLAQSRHSRVLSAYAPLLDLIVESDVVSRYFSFTSLNRLCFSRCMLFPFDTEGMPMLAPAERGRFWVADVGGYMSHDEPSEPVQLDTAEALLRLEDLLSMDDGRVHPGNVDDAMADEVNAAFESAGSKLRAAKVQERQWLRVVVRADDGRTGRLSGDGKGRVRLKLAEESKPIEMSLDEAVRTLMDQFEIGAHGKTTLRPSTSRGPNMSGSGTTQHIDDKIDLRPDPNRVDAIKTAVRGDEEPP